MPSQDLLDERGAWHQRIAATLFHQGAPAIGGMATPGGRAAAAEADLSPAGRPGPGCARPAGSPPELDPLRRQLNMLSRRQPGCRALRATQFGVGPVTSVAIWAELGDVRRLASSGDAVRHTGLDITVYSSDSSRPAGHLSRQGPELLRRARYESASCATRPAAPGYRYHTLRDLAPAGRPREPERCRPESPIHRLANLMRCARDKRTRVTNAASKTPPAPAGSATSTGIAGALARSPVLLSIPSPIVPGPGA
jgi:Transposase IS116/IS110/IS902 family